MTPRLTILILLSAFAVMAQPMPPPVEFKINLNIWPAQPVAQTFTFVEPSRYTVMESDDLVNWSVSNVKPVLTYTVTNNGAHKFFRVVRQWPIAWNPPPDADVTGYKLYLGETGTNYTRRIDVGNVTHYTLTLPFWRTFIAATAYDASGTESEYSNEITLNY